MNVYIIEHVKFNTLLNEYNQIKKALDHSFHKLINSAQSIFQ